MPVLTYVIGGREFDLYPEEYYIQDEYDPNFCSPGMFAMDVFMDRRHPSIVIGVVFMRKFFTVFDRDYNRVGFALANSRLTLNGETEADRIQTNQE